LADAEGESLRTLFENGGTTLHRPAYLESLFGRLCCGWAPLHGWRDGRFTLIDAPRPELYDAAADPGQLQNLASSHRDEFDRLQRQLTALTSSAPSLGPTLADRDTVERLQSLGYLSASGDGGGMRPSLRDPKDMADVAARLGRAIETVDVDPSSAARELERLLQADAENPLIRRHLVRARVRSGDTAGARRELEALTARGDRSGETLELVADLAISAGDLAAARPALERIYRETNDPDVGLKLGIVLMRLQQVDAAIEIFRSVVARSPTHQEALVDLGGALLQAKRSREAVDAFERAVAAGARAPLVWNGLAAARLANGDRTGAAAALRESLRAKADQPQVRAMLQQLAIN
jgi:predicted Zn-dependent protease